MPSRARVSYPVLTLLLIVFSTGPAALAAQDRSRLVRAQGEEIHRVIGHYAAVEADSIEDRLTVELDSLRADHTKLLQALPKVPEDARRAVSDQISSLQVAIQTREQHLQAMAEDPYRKLAGAIVCRDARAPVDALWDDFQRNGTPPVTSADLTSALVVARGAVASLAAIEPCPDLLRPRLQELQDAYQIIANRTGLSRRQRSYFDDLDRELKALAALRGQHVRVVDVTARGAQAVRGLAESAQGTVEAFERVANGMELFHEVEGDVEKVDLLRGLGAALTGAGVSGWGVAGEDELTAGLGVALWFLGDLIKGSYAPEPVRKFAGAMAANRLLGLSLQEMQVQIALARERADSTRTAKSVEEGRAVLPILDSIQGVFEFTEVISIALQELEAPGDTVSDERWNELRGAYRTFEQHTRNEFAVDEARVVTTRDLVGSALEEVDIFRQYALALRVGAERLRQLLGQVGDDVCKQQGHRYPAFCAIPSFDHGEWLFAKVAAPMDSARLNDLMAAGEALAASASRSAARISDATVQLRQIRATLDTAWTTYQQAMVAGRNRIRATVALVPAPARAVAGQPE